jgi:hypothetical protein
MHASIMLVALVAPPAALEVQQAEGPAWQPTYTAARELGRKEHKPLAVVFGSGEKGWESLTQDNHLSPAVQKLLADNYVCTYVDSSTQRGQRLANAFALSQGLVLSTSDGEVQAFRHSGRIDNRDLVAALRRHGTEAVSFRAGALGDQEESEDQPKKKVEKDKMEPGKGKMEPSGHHHVYPGHHVTSCSSCGSQGHYVTSCSSCGSHGRWSGCRSRGCGRCGRGRCR